MSDVLSTCVLVIGKSGTGKSAMLNYMFGEGVEKTGTGRPVTQKGIYPHEYKYKDNFHINIYDTWGLEADKSGEWHELIIDEVHKHDLKEIPEWFNTIIYCLSAESKRVEKFETDMISSLLEGKNNIVVALTHSTSPNLKDNEGMVRELREKTKIPQERIINICSVSGETIVGTKFEQFGKDAIFGAIVDNLWESISGKLPNILKGEFHQNLEREKNKQIDAVKENITPGKALIDKLKFAKKFSGSETMEEFGDKISNDIQNFIRTANGVIGKRLSEANTYYYDLFDRYNNQISVQQQREVRVNIKCDFFREYKYDLSDILTFSDLKSIRKNVADLFLKDNLKNIPNQFHAIIERLKFNWKTVKNKQTLAEKTINDCFDELKKVFNSEIDNRLENINDIYKPAVK